MGEQITRICILRIGARSWNFSFAVFVFNPILLPPLRHSFPSPTVKSKQRNECILFYFYFRGGFLFPVFSSFFLVLFWGLFFWSSIPPLLPPPHRYFETMLTGYFFTTSYSLQRLLKKKKKEKSTRKNKKYHLFTDEVRYRRENHKRKCKPKVV